MSKNYPGVLSQGTLEKVALIINDEALAQRECQLQKKALTDHNKNFCSINAFNRIDRAAKGFINSLDLVQFFRDNQKIIPESDTYMLINAFDSNKDGKLSLVDFGKMVCPVSYSSRMNFKSTSKNYVYAQDNNSLSLGYDIEHAIIRICEREMQSVKKVEVLKQELMTYSDYSMLEIFRAIDLYSHGFINSDNLRVFFRNFEFCYDIDEEDIQNWIRRYDRDVDLQLDYSDFVSSLGPYCNYTQKAQDLIAKPSQIQTQADEIQNQINNNLQTKASQKNFDVISKKTKTTAASLNGAKTEKTQKYTQSEKPKLQYNNQRVETVNKFTKSQSINNNLKQKYMQTAGEILNYPFSSEIDNQKQQDSRLQYEEGYKIADIQNQQLYSPEREDFEGAKQFATAIFDMTDIEGELEKKRRELVLRSDFNLCDVFKMFGGLKNRSRIGIDCDDLYYTITENLELTITKDEVFIMFYKLDKDGSGFIDYNKFADCFMPRSNEYKVLLESRGGFYGGESDFKKYFEEKTRELLKVFIKGYVDCEVSIELVRQRITNKIKIQNRKAFNGIDQFNRGALMKEDFKNFMKNVNIYPIDKYLDLLFERFDKDQDGVVSFEEFVAGITPFMNNQQL